MTENDQVKATIDREAELLASAVRLVASGGARRTTVGNLRLSEAAIAIVRPWRPTLVSSWNPSGGPTRRAWTSSSDESPLPRRSRSDLG